MLAITSTVPNTVRISTLERVLQKNSNFILMDHKYRQPNYDMSLSKSSMYQKLKWKHSLQILHNNEKDFREEVCSLIRTCCTHFWGPNQTLSSVLMYSFVSVLRASRNVNMQIFPALRYNPFLHKTYYGYLHVLYNRARGKLFISWKAKFIQQRYQFCGAIPNC